MAGTSTSYELSRAGAAGGISGHGSVPGAQEHQGFQGFRDSRDSRDEARAQASRVVDSTRVASRLGTRRPISRRTMAGGLRGRKAADQGQCDDRQPVGSLDSYFADMFS